METSKKDRSRSYPSLTLSEALKRLDNINENLGANGSYNRESVVVGMGYSGISGTSSRAAASMDQYGLLRRIKDLYSLTDDAKKYLFPVSDSDRDEVIRSAALSSPLFRDIFNALEGQVIPRQFANRLIQEFGIQPKAAAEVERIFRSTMETAGLLANNGMLSGSRKDNTTADKASGASANPSSEATVGIRTDTSLLSVNLPSGLIVSYPQSLASAFAFGLFGETLLALDNKVMEYVHQASSASGEGTDHE